MEPQLPNPNFSPERTAQEPKTPERISDQPKTSEVLPAQPLEQLRSSETHEKKTGAGVADNTAPAAAQTTTVTAPPPASDDTASAVVAHPDPATASDDDVIEKEWINKAKKTVAATKGDPYLKEQEISKLQATYMLKRFNKEIKIPSDA